MGRGPPGVAGGSSGGKISFRCPSFSLWARSSTDTFEWNEALSLIEIVADYVVVEAAHDIDRAIWPVHLKIKAGLTRDQEWFPLRDQIESRRQAFVNVAGRRLAPAGPPLR